MGKTWAQTRYALGSISHGTSSCSPFPTSWSWCTVSTLSFKTHWVIIIQPRGDKFVDSWCHLSSQTLQGVRPKAQPWQMWAACFSTEGEMMFKESFPSSCILAVPGFIHFSLLDAVQAICSSPGAVFLEVLWHAVRVTGGIRGEWGHCHLQAAGNQACSTFSISPSHPSQSKRGRRAMWMSMGCSRMGEQSLP